MMLAVEAVVSPTEAADLAEAAAALDFEDGRRTAGRFAAPVKRNDQARQSPARTALLERVAKAILAHPVIQSAARPRLMSPLLLSRYRPGQDYGLHVDDALMGGMRSDLSFTLFLAPPESYDGGALVIEDALEDRAIKLPAGDLILYPSTTLHRVDPVTRGERLAVVGWVQSLIRSPDQREILFDLDRAIETIFDREGKSAVFDRLAKTRSNLIRMWAEV